MKKPLLYLFLLFTSMSQADESLNIETLPLLRTRQYPMVPYKKIVVYSAPRTGSSLIYNVFRFLFEKQTKLSRYHDDFNMTSLVLRTHRSPDLERLKEESVLYIIPIRNPIQASISTYRIRPTPVEDIELFCKKLLLRQEKHLLFAEKMKNAGKNVIFIKYEDFENNLDYLIDFVEKSFYIAISQKDKEIIKSGYSKENVYSSVKELSSFNEYLHASGFHGKHVSLEQYVPPDGVLYWLNYYLPEVKESFAKYGYFLD